MALFFSNKYKKIIIIIIFLSCLIFFSGNAVLAEEIITPFPYNPAANYCQEMGYEWIIKTTEEGDEAGFCKISDDILCDEWEFLTGKCGQEYNYCQRQGYQFKSLSNSEKCQSAFSPDCVVCVFANGAEIETSKTMKLDKESKCGDKICYPPQENYGNCPYDCASGEKPNNRTVKVIILVIAIILIAGAGAAAYYFFVRKNKGNTDDQNF